MASIDFTNTITECMGFAKNELGKSWKSFKDFAEHHFSQLARDAEFLAGLKSSGKINDDEFKARLQLQMLSLQNVVMTLKGIALITAQNVVNGVIGIIAKTIKKAMGIALPL